MELGLTEMTLLALFALAGGMVFSWFKQPPILGYILCGLILFLTNARTISLPFSRVILKDKELVTLTSFAFCIAASWVATQFGLSQPFGAFLAGLFLGNTEQHKVLLDTIKPVQTLLLTFFFFSVGSLMDFQYVIQHFWSFMLLLSVVTVGKSVANVVLLRVLRLSWSDAFIVGILLAQLGEFAFLLVNKAKALHVLLLDEELRIVSLTVLSLSFSSVWIKFIKKMKITEDVNIVSFVVMMQYLLGGSVVRTYNRFMLFTGLKKPKIYLHRLLDRNKKEAK